MKFIFQSWIIFSSLRSSWKPRDRSLPAQPISIRKAQSRRKKKAYIPLAVLVDFSRNRVTFQIESSLSTIQKKAVVTINSGLFYMIEVTLDEWMLNFVCFVGQPVWEVWLRSYGHSDCYYCPGNGGTREHRCRVLFVCLFVCLFVLLSSFQRQIPLHECGWGGEGRGR